MKVERIPAPPPPVVPVVSIELTEDEVGLLIQVAKRDLTIPKLIFGDAERNEGLRLSEFLTILNDKLTRAIK